jgi:multidrug efflux pump subunit AcrA (membrane-fusion protein)
MAAILLNPTDRLIGSVVDIDRATLLDSLRLTVRSREPFPPGVSVGMKVGSLIEIGEIKDAVYFERPANAHANSEMPLFVVEPNGEFAKRVAVRFGRQSGALLQILDGLSPGDRVIVTDTTKWNSNSRLRIK